MCQKFGADGLSLKKKKKKTHILYNLKLSWANEFSINSLGQQPCAVNMSTNQEAGFRPLAVTGSWPTGLGRYIYIYTQHRLASQVFIFPDDKKRDSSWNNGLLTIRSPNAAASLRKFYWLHMLPFFAFLPSWHVNKKTVPITQQMALLPWPLLQHTYFFLFWPCIFV